MTVPLVGMNTLTVAMTEDVKWHHGKRCHEDDEEVAVAEGGCAIRGS